MAYLRDLPKCRACTIRQAVCEVFNNRNASLGHYCRSCGNRALKKQEKHEQATIARDALVAGASVQKLEPRF